MTMKKLLALLLVLVMVVALVACGGNGNETEAPTNNSQPASDATEDTGNSDTPVGIDLKVAVFYYTYSDTYISSVRTALDAQLDALGISATHAPFVTEQWPHGCCCSSWSSV